MKFLLIIVVSVNIIRLGLSLSSLEGAYSEWKNDFNKGYICEDEDTRGFYNFVRNMGRINEHNLLYLHQCNITYKLALWDRSDLSEFEINKMYNGLKISSAEPEELVVEDRSLFLGGIEIISPNETNFDWRERNVITAVRDQGNCASCYAMASNGALEAQIALITQNLTKLSDQQIIDCSFDYGNYGCSGGDTGATYEYIIQNGIAYALEYPYEGMETGNCSYNQTMQNATLGRYQYLRIMSDALLMVKPKYIISVTG